MSAELIHVGFGEYKISSDPEAVLAAFGLGSCVGVTLYDPVEKIAGMIHVVLPSNDGRSSTLLSKYADTGLPLLLSEILKAGAKKHGLIVKMAGGAEILKQNYPLESLEIGRKNLEKCKEVLRQLGVRVRAMQTGGNRGRTLKLYVGTGKTTVRTINEEIEF